MLYPLFYLMHHWTYPLLLEISHVEVQDPRGRVPPDTGAECWLLWCASGHNQPGGSGHHVPETLCFTDSCQILPTDIHELWGNLVKFKLFIALSLPHHLPQSQLVVSQQSLLCHLYHGFFSQISPTKTMSAWRSLHFEAKHFSRGRMYKIRGV